MKMKIIYRVSQYSLHGEHLCDFGFFESERLAFKEMFKGFEKLYKDFKINSWKNGHHNEWYYKEEFIVRITPIIVNKFEEI